MFSPHTRGCSVWLDDNDEIHVVFPAYAGMFRRMNWYSSPSTSFPRIRGDVPAAANVLGYRCVFSPHTRGCSVIPSIFPGRPSVFPAYAGMFRIQHDCGVLGRRFPRIRGDVPSARNARIDYIWFSPHTRGCSGVWGPRGLCSRVFPAYAGMFRGGRSRSRIGVRFPRIRGDVPVSFGEGVGATQFSPHTRGCSSLVIPATRNAAVFPAYAGMFLNYFKKKKFSPHTRGCSCFAEDRSAFL